MNLNRSANLRNQSVNIIDKNLTGKQATVNFSKLELKQKNTAGSNKSCKRIAANYLFSLPSCSLHQAALPGPWSLQPTFYATLIELSDFDTLLSQKSNNYMDSISSYYLKN